MTRSDRAYSAMRTALIAYGSAAYVFLMSRYSGEDIPRAIGDLASAPDFLMGGVILQVLMIVAGFIARRSPSESAPIHQILEIIRLLADGLTVLLFAMATYGALLHRASSVA